jgi:hypothetical protein
MYRIDCDDALILETSFADDALATLDALVQAHEPERVQAFVWEGGAYREHPTGGDWIDCSGWAAIDRADLEACIETEERDYQDARAQGWVA